MSLAVLAEARASVGYGRRVRLADVWSTLASSDAGLLERFVGLMRIDEVQDLSTGLEAACLIENTSAVASWQEALCSGPARIVEQPETGRLLIHTLAQGAALRAPGLGVLVVEAAGPVACLIEPPPASLAANEVPNHALLPLILRSELLIGAGRLVVHAGAAGKDGDCEIWTGPSGAGKTTQVLRLAHEGAELFGDDQIIVGRDAAGAWRVWSDWRPPRVTAETCRTIAPLAFLEQRPASLDGKRAFDAQKVLGLRRPGSARLTQINYLVPERQAVSRPLAPGEAFERIAPGFLRYLWAGHAGCVTDLVLDLLSTVPVRLVSWGAL